MILGRIKKAEYRSRFLNVCGDVYISAVQKPGDPKYYLPLVGNKELLPLA